MDTETHRQCAGGCAGQRCSDTLYRAGCCFDPAKRGPDPIVVELARDLDVSVEDLFAYALDSVGAPEDTMPSLQQTVAPELTPELRTRVAALLSVYATLNAESKLLKEQADIEKASIYKLLKDAGVEEATIDEFKVKEVQGSTSKLDKVEFVEKGGSLDVLNACTHKTDSKPYLKITVGGEE